MITHRSNDFSLLRFCIPHISESTPCRTFSSVIVIGVSPAFWKNTTLRACKILYSFSANPVTNENPKTAPG
ncbi:hypothetical protein COD94_27785 [Bacillus cereus]|nr:hypothetical protein COD94_27785 [Bacillus cereus]